MKPTSEWCQVSVSDYTDKNGKLLYQVIRKERGKGTKREKKFVLRRPDGLGGWIWNMNGVRRVPYRLPNVFFARVVIVVEGEKSADALRACIPRKVAVTTNSEGAGKFGPELIPYLAGKL